MTRETRPRRFPRLFEHKHLWLHSHETNSSQLCLCRDPVPFRGLGYSSAGKNIAHCYRTSEKQHKLYLENDKRTDQGWCSIAFVRELEQAISYQTQAVFPPAAAKETQEWLQHLYRPTVNPHRQRGLWHILGLVLSSPAESRYLGRKEQKYIFLVVRWGGGNCIWFSTHSPLQKNARETLLIPIPSSKPFRSYLPSNHYGWHLCFFSMDRCVVAQLTRHLIHSGAVCHYA